MHAPVADAFLDTGVHIICDKPLTTTLEEARRLGQGTTRGLIFAVTYNYSGYPLVRHACSMAQGGELGAIRIVQGSNIRQDWLADPLEVTGQKQADSFFFKRSGCRGAALATSVPMPTQFGALCNRDDA